MNAVFHLALGNTSVVDRSARLLCGSICLQARPESGGARRNWRVADASRDWSGHGRIVGNLAREAMKKFFIVRGCEIDGKRKTVQIHHLIAVC